MKLAVGFITFNDASAKYLDDFLPSLDRALRFLAPGDYEIYAFDNSSLDHKANHQIITAFNAGRKNPIRLLTLGSNLGFARAYNILIDSAWQDKAEYFLIINPDTIVEEDAISKMVAALDRDGSLGSVSPKILRWDFPNRQKTDMIDSLGIVLRPGLSFSDLGQGQTDKKQFDRSPILGPSGAAGLFRLSGLRQIATGQSLRRQYYDERFFMYKEDCDLAYRLFLAGFRSQLIPEAVIYHDRTATSSGEGRLAIIRDRRGKSRQIRSWSFKNQHLIFIKHWKQQNFVNRIIIVERVAIMFIFSLILEQFLLKEYLEIYKAGRG